MRIDPNWWQDLFDEFYLQTDFRSIGDIQAFIVDEAKKHRQLQEAAAE